MSFDFNAARKAGYSDAEISDYLAPKYNFDIQGARSSGYSDSEIVSLFEKKNSSVQDFAESVVSEVGRAGESLVSSAGRVGKSFVSGVVSGAALPLEVSGKVGAAAQALMPAPSIKPSEEVPIVEQQAVISAKEPQGIVSKFIEDTATAMKTGLIGPSREQVLSEGILNPKTGQVEYKPAASEIERRGLIGGLINAVKQSGEVGKEIQKKAVEIGPIGGPSGIAEKLAAGVGQIPGVAATYTAAGPFGPLIGAITEGVDEQGNIDLKKAAVGAARDIALIKGGGKLAEAAIPSTQKGLIAAVGAPAILSASKKLTGQEVTAEDAVVESLLFGIPVKLASMPMDKKISGIKEISKALNEETIVEPQIKQLESKIVDLEKAPAIPTAEAAAQRDAISSQLDQIYYDTLSRWEGFKKAGQLFQSLQQAAESPIESPLKQNAIEVLNRIRFTQEPSQLVVSEQIGEGPRVGAKGVGFPSELKTQEQILAERLAQREPMAEPVIKPEAPEIKPVEPVELETVQEKLSRNLEQRDAQALADNISDVLESGRVFGEPVNVTRQSIEKSLGIRRKPVTKEAAAGIIEREKKTAGELEQQRIFDEAWNNALKKMGVGEQRKSSVVDRVIETLENSKVETAGKVFDFVAGVSTSVYNASIDILVAGLKAGKTVAEAVSSAVKYVKENNEKKKFDEAGLRDAYQSYINIGRKRAYQKTSLENVLPAFLPKQQANQIFSQKFGVEKIPIEKIPVEKIPFEKIPFVGKKIWNVVKKIKDEGIAEGPLSTYYVEKYGVAPAARDAAALFLGGKVNEVFKATEKGDLNVGTTSKGQSEKIGDVFTSIQQDPNSYQLTQEQKTALNTKMNPILDHVSTLIKENNLVEFEDELGEFSYFPRQVVEMPQAKEAGAQLGGARVGSKQFFQKQRAFKTEAEGWEKGYKYETDIEKRLVTLVERVYKAVADKRLIEDPELGSTTRKQLEADLNEAYAEKLASGKMTEDTIKRIADGVQSAGTVWQPGFYGKIFDRKTAEFLNNEFGAESSSVIRTLASVNDFKKALDLGFDLGVGAIQLLPTAFSNPRVWAEANWNSIKSMASKDVFASYAKNNQAEIAELAKYGSQIGSMPEMISGFESGILKKIPVAKDITGAFGRQVQTALDVAKIELFKSAKESMSAKELADPDSMLKLIQSIENQIGSARMRSAGLSAERVLTERVLLLAPTYYRSAVNMIANLGSKDITGQMARKALGSYLAGGAALFAGAAALSGMDWDEIKKRMNPARSDFMMIKAKIGDKEINVGFGGIYRSLIRLAGNIAKTSAEEPGNWMSLSSEKNPITRWYRGHAGPSVSMAWNYFSGKDFLGKPVDIKTIYKTSGPLWLQGMFTRHYNEGKAIPQESAIEFVGLNVLPDYGAGSDVKKDIRSWMSGSKDPNVKSLFEKRQQLNLSESEYSKLRRAVQNNDIETAKEEIKGLLVTKKPKDIVEAMSPDKSLTGSRMVDALYMRQLDEAGKKQLQDSMRQRRELFSRFRTALQEVAKERSKK